MGTALVHLEARAAEAFHLALLCKALHMIGLGFDALGLLLIALLLVDFCGVLIRLFRQ